MRCPSADGMTSEWRTWNTDIDMKNVLKRECDASPAWIRIPTADASTSRLTR